MSAQRSPYRVGETPVEHRGRERGRGGKRE